MFENSAEKFSQQLPESNHKARHHRLAALAMTGLSLSGLYAQSADRQATRLSPPGIVLSPRAAELASTVSETTKEGPVQSDPRFAAHPTWWENFNQNRSGKVNSMYWNIFTGPAPANDQAEYNTGLYANLRVKGDLTIEARHQASHGYNYTSARIDTAGKQTFMYGKLVFTAELPSGIGSWPSIWLESADNKYENAGPANEVKKYLNDGEVDIVEAIGINECLDYSVVHTLKSAEKSNQVGYHNSIKVPDCNTSFNQYSIAWTPNNMTFSVNDKIFFTYVKPEHAGFATWPFDQPYYLVIDLAEGGTWGGMDKKIYPPDGINNAQLPTTMKISRIDYYPYVGKRP